MLRLLHSIIEQICCEERTVILTTYIYTPENKRFKDNQFFAFFIKKQRVSDAMFIPELESTIYLTGVPN